MTQRRSRIWITVGHSAVVPDNTNSLAATIRQDTDVSLADCTIVRYAAQVSAFSTDGAGTAAGCAYLGLIVVNADAFDAGAASIPDPQLDSDADWLFIHAFHVGQGGQPVNTVASAHDLRVDNRSKRKMMGRNKVLASVFKNAIGNGAELDVHGRALVLLH